MFLIQAFNNFMMHHQWKQRGIKIPRGSTISANTQIGDGTRINGPIDIKGKGDCLIGRHCAFGANIRIITSNHSTNHANLQCHLQRKIGAPEIDICKGPVTIGNNVWIGDSVIILSGVTIGDGAVIGAGAVITRDIPDFTLAAGVPAKPIRPRFSPSICTQLKELAWWNWDHARLKRNQQLFAIDFTHASDDIRLKDVVVD